MPTRESMLELLSQNLHLFTPGKQHVARWLCDDWSRNGGGAPRWLERALKGARDVPVGSLRRPEALLRDLSLELLSQHRAEVLRRRRVGAERGVPLGPRSVAIAHSQKGPA